MWLLEGSAHRLIGLEIIRHQELNYLSTLRHTVLAPAYSLIDYKTGEPNHLISLSEIQITDPLLLHMNYIVPSDSFIPHLRAEIVVRFMA